MTRIKFCGLASPEEIELATDLGASYVGIVVQAPKSHRNQDLATAEALIDAAPVDVRTVLVTPTHDADALREAVDTCRPEVVQISGDPPRDAIEDVIDAHDVDTWKSARLASGVDETVTELTALQTVHDAAVLDALEDGYGGHGQTIDWVTAGAVVEELSGFPVVLAGGLTPTNVSEAIRRVTPWCVDVSSGVEADQVKDPEKMQSFASAVRGQEVSR